MSQEEFDHDFDHDEDEFDGDDSIDARVWQLLQLINPGDEELALQEFDDYRERAADMDADDLIPVDLIGEVIDWRSGFMLDAQDLHGLVQAIDELSARWNVTIDWNGDPDDDEFFDDMDAGTLFSIAWDRLAESGYALWSWETGDGRLAGWMTLARDGEPLRELATALDINLRPGSDVG